MGKCAFFLEKIGEVCYNIIIDPVSRRGEGDKKTVNAETIFYQQQNGVDVSCGNNPSFCGKYSIYPEYAQPDKR